MTNTPITDALIDAGKITTSDVASAMRKLERDLRKCKAGEAALDAHIAAGRDLLAEVEMLRFEMAKSQIPTTVDAVEREEWRQERDALRLKVTAAEGMAEAFENHRCGCQNQELRAALAAWQEANK